MAAAGSAEVEVEEEVEEGERQIVAPAYLQTAQCSGCTQMGAHSDSRAAPARSQRQRSAIFIGARMANPIQITTCYISANHPLHFNLASLYWQAGPLSLSLSPSMQCVYIIPRPRLLIPSSSSAGIVVLVCKTTATLSKATHSLARPIRLY